MYVITGVLGLLFTLAYIYMPTGSWVLGILREFFGVMISAVTLSLIWDHFQKRDFTEEILSTQKLVLEIEETGLIGVSNKWHGEVDWKDLLKSARDLDIFFIYGRTWLTSNREAIVNFTAQDDAKINIILPDPEHRIVMQHLAHRMGLTSKELKKRIKETTDDFAKIFSTINPRNRCAIWYAPVSPVYSYYRIDGEIIVTFYKNAFTKADNVPTLSVKRGGGLYSFFKSDVDELIDANSAARKVFPVKKK